MKVQSSTYIASEVKESLLKKALAIIAKRQLLFKNMNVYSVDQLSKLMQEINEQAVMVAHASTIEETNDLNANPKDNMMSMSEVTLMELPGQFVEGSPSLSQYENLKESKMRHLTSTRHEKLSIMDLLEDDQAAKSYVTCLSLSRQEKEEESREIQAYRTIKQREYEQMIKKQAEQKKKLPVFINLNQERVMFGYDSKIIKLQKMKERKNHNLSQMESVLTIPDNGDKSKRKNMFNLNQTPLIINNKINLTLKEQEEVKQKQKKYKRNHAKNSMSVQPQSPSSIIKVNPQSHKEHESAIFVPNPGVKILIQQKEFSLDKESPRYKLDRRMTRSQYLQIRTNQQIKQIFRHSNATLINQAKIRPEERLKTEYLKEDKSETEKKLRKRRFLLTGFADNKRNNSKIEIHSLQGKAELLTKAKQKSSVFSTIEQPSKQLNKKQSLSSVDRYNLLYIKYKGNPPADAEQSLIQQLQTQSKIHLKDKPSILSLYTNKKSNVKRQNRLIKR